ncbi:YbaK/EbsC family protein [Ignatzschineria rhizosphaerae]|uniref:YbaK/EbsC family protein n=1 Tax=Ignatzschineria rhizosphaerae TaxID=2923279 RepID=A0ABY3X296_9GAMM|nr:YbaK/EbsC family protein [Ignatzschineria rhizosphaerae]UNM95582.1 YbaK/EbsC family protein [Ignatzschineria rhizosphaerae]
MGNTPTHPAITRVAKFLAQKSHPHRPIMLDDSARTAQEAADSLQCEISQIAKSIIFHNLVNDEAILVIISGDKRVDEKKVTALLEISRSKLGKASADFVREKTGFAIGGVSPVAHTSTCKIFLDESLKRFEVIWAAAGHPKAVFQASPQALEMMVDATWVSVASE